MNVRPPKRRGDTFHFSINSLTGEALEGYVTINRWDDKVMEIFLSASKQGSFVHGMMDTLAILVSNSLQADLSLYDVCKSLVGIRFEPFGPTDDPDVPYANSMPDYLGRRLALYLTDEERIKLSQHVKKETGRG
jgi:hypothetical protein